MKPSIFLPAVLLSAACLGFGDPITRHSVAVGQEKSGESKPDAPASPADAAAPVDTTGTPKPADTPLPLGPGMVSPIAKVPKTPQELFDATALMVELARLDLAKVYLQKLMSTELKAEDLWAIRQAKGPAIFLKMANLKELQPESIRLLDQVNAAFRQHASNPDVIHGLINQLSGDSETREAAYVELRAAGVVVLPIILQDMQDPQQLARRNKLTELVSRMGRPVVPLLIAALETQDPDLLGRVLTILGTIRDTRATPHLWYYAVSEQVPEMVRTAARIALERVTQTDLSSVIKGGRVPAILRDQARVFYRGQPVAEPDKNGMVQFWSWNPEQKTVVARMLPSADATQLWALKFARQALELSPGDIEIQTVYLTGGLGFETTEKSGIWTTPEGTGTAFDKALSSGAEATARVLDVSLDDRRLTAAVAALRVLARTGTVAQLQSSSTNAPAVIRALNDPDPRVQYEAAQTVLALRPKQGFQGQQRVPQILARALTVTPESPRQALILDTLPGRGTSVAGILNSLGYETSLNATGRAGFSKASSGVSPDLVMIHTNITRWDLTETLVNFRADSRTAGLPILIYGDTYPNIDSEAPITVATQRRQIPLPRSARVVALEADRIPQEHWGRAVLNAELTLPQRIEAAKSLSKDVRIKGLLMESGEAAQLQRLSKGNTIPKLSVALAGFSGVYRSTVESPHLVSPVSSVQEPARDKYTYRLSREPAAELIWEPLSSEDLSRNIKRLVAQHGAPALSSAERQRQAKGAAEALALISRTALLEVFPLTEVEPALIQGSHNADLLYDVLPALGTLTTATSQQRLAELVLDSRIDTERRVQAVTVLTGHLKRNGLRIGQSELTQIMQLSAENKVPELRTSLSALAGALKPDTAAIGDGLIKYHPQLPKDE